MSAAAMRLRFMEKHLHLPMGAGVAEASRTTIGDAARAMRSAAKSLTSAVS
jgi:hypothetical protein